MYFPLTMLTYQDHSFPLAPEEDLLAALKRAPESLRICLDGWMASRKADLELSSLRLIEREGGERGVITLGFEETQWLACRLETGSQPHQVRIPFRIEEGMVVLSTLPRDAFGERIDEF